MTAEILSMPEPDQPTIPAWFRRSNESEKSYQAFCLYMGAGAQRSLVKVGQALGKSNALLSRWSARHDWVSRAEAFDRTQAAEINKRLMAGTAAMRQRHAEAAEILTSRAAERIRSMTPKEIQELSVLETAALLGKSAEIESKARTIDDGEAAGGWPIAAPTFVIQHIHPGRDEDGQPMIGVRFLHEGQEVCGYVPRREIGRFKADYPDAVILC